MQRLNPASEGQDFFKKANELLHAKGEILSLIYYKNGAGSRDFMLIRSERSLREIVQRLNPGDELTIFKAFQPIIQGPASEVFDKVSQVPLPSNPVGDWLLIFENGLQQEWQLLESSKEIMGELSENLNSEVTIIHEPDWHNPHTFIRAYAPIVN